MDNIKNVDSKTSEIKVFGFTEAQLAEMQDLHDTGQSDKAHLNYVLTSLALDMMLALQEKRRLYPSIPAYLGYSLAEIYGFPILEETREYVKISLDPQGEWLCPTWICKLGCLIENDLVKMIPYKVVQYLANIEIR